MFSPASPGGARVRSPEETCPCWDNGHFMAVVKKSNGGVGESSIVHEEVCWVD